MVNDFQSGTNQVQWIIIITEISVHVCVNRAVFRVGNKHDVYIFFVLFLFFWEREKDHFMIQLRADGSVLTRKNDPTDGTEKLSTAELFLFMYFFFRVFLRCCCCFQSMCGRHGSLSLFKARSSLNLISFGFNEPRHIQRESLDDGLLFG